MREINDENAKGITDAASGLAQSLADLKLRLRSEADRGKIEPIRTTVLPDFTAKVGELITMLNEANEEIGRAHVRTPVTNAHLVCRLLLEQKKKKILSQKLRRETHFNTVRDHTLHKQ